MMLDSTGIDQEAATLGAMVQHQSAATHALDVLRVDDFVRPDHKLIFNAVAEMRTKNEPVDALSVMQWMKRDGLLTQTDREYVLGLPEKTPVVANFRAYVRGVRDLAMLRELHATGVQMAEATTKNAADALSDATEKLVELRGRLDGRMQQRRVDAESMAEDFCAAYVADQAEGGDVIPFPRHLPMLNSWTMGQRPGRLVVSGGLTGHGKSWFGLDCSDTTLEAGERVAYFALELPAAEITERLIAMRGVSYNAIQQRTADYDSMHDAIQHVANWGNRLHVFDGTTPLSRIEAEIVSAFVSRRPYRYVVIDTINLIDHGNTHNLRQAIDKTMLRLKQLTIDYGCTIHIQAQMNRDKRRDPLDPPTLADLKESSGIEQAADLVLFIHRFPSGTDEELSDHGVLVVAKGRNIKRRGRIYVDFDTTGMRFVQSAHQGQSFMAGMPRGKAA